MKVLLVDDELFCLSVAQKFLEDAGYTVIAAHSVNEAISLLDQGIDIVITDILMPNKLGYELITHIKNSDNPIPVIAVSGGFENAVDDYVHQAEIFADVAIAKPLHKDNLIKTVKTLI